MHFLNFRITFSPSRDDPRDADEGQQDEADDDDDDDSEDQDDSADQDDPEDKDEDDADDEDDAEDENDGQEFEFDPATGQWLLDMNLESSSSCSSPSLLDPSFSDKTHKRKK